MKRLEEMKHAPCETAPPFEEPGRWLAFFAAVRFLTRLPLGAADRPTAETLRRSAVYFPVVGAFVGIVTAAVLAAGSLIWPLWLAVVVALAAEAWLTGALHEDGLADFCDAFGGGWRREDVLAILADSRIGSYGSLALIFGTALKAGAMFALIQRVGVVNWPVWSAAVVAAAALGRWAMVAAMYLLRPVEGRDSLSRDVGGKLTKRELISATALAAVAAAASAVLMPWHFLFAVSLCAAGLLVLLLTIRRRLRGTTGDCLGCVGYTSEVLALLASAARIERWITFPLT